MWIILVVEMQIWLKGAANLWNSVASKKLYMRCKKNDQYVLFNTVILRQMSDKFLKRIS